jgi:hypothetical protein
VNDERGGAQAMMGQRVTRWVRVVVGVCALGLAGCASVGSVGLMVKSTATPAELARAQSFQDLGYTEASDCRYLIIGVLPLGNADPGHVLEKALAAKGADALLNVTTSNSHYGFVPIYNVFSITCTSLAGTAIKFQPTPGS